MVFKVTVNQDDCISCAACSAVCDNFEVKDKAEVKNSPVDEIGCNQEAADACPQNCIHIEEV